MRHKDVSIDWTRTSVNNFDLHPGIKRSLKLFFSNSIRVSGIAPQEFLPTIDLEVATEYLNLRGAGWPSQEAIDNRHGRGSPKPVLERVRRRVTGILRYGLNAIETLNPSPPLYDLLQRDTNLRTISQVVTALRQSPQDLYVGGFHRRDAVFDELGNLVRPLLDPSKPIEEIDRVRRD